MRVGLLKERVKLRRLTETVDGVGQVVQSWTNLDSTSDGCVAARATFMKAKEDQIYGGITSDTKMVFEILYRRDLDLTCQVQWEDSNWNIIGINRDEDKQWLRLIVTEIARGVTSIHGSGDATLPVLTGAGVGTVS